MNSNNIEEIILKVKLLLTHQFSYVFRKLLSLYTEWLVFLLQCVNLMLLKACTYHNRIRFIFDILNARHESRNNMD